MEMYYPIQNPQPYLRQGHSPNYVSGTWPIHFALTLTNINIFQYLFHQIDFAMVDHIWPITFYELTHLCAWQSWRTCPLHPSSLSFPSLSCGICRISQCHEYLFTSGLLKKNSETLIFESLQDLCTLTIHQNFSSLARNRIIWYRPFRFQNMHKLHCSSP